ncbi:alkaline phosphatase 4 [Lucilia cuprina]|uniref:alkaline phosphatase 4 n=1 Tax=Lucilia cuprina TaxID=7375 RepID=UPI001F061A32|nr:alkaline phosphatase 4 [Lucilia cuprina]
MDTQRLVTTKRKFKSTQLFLVAGTILISLLVSVLCIGLTVRYEVDTETADVESVPYWKLKLPPQQEVWYEKGIEELKSVIVKKEQRGEVENVIIFIAEGVNSDMLSRARFMKEDNNSEINHFIWDSFPHLGILKSSCSFEPTCDAFSLATALFGGVRTLNGLGGVDKRVNPRNCQQASNDSFHISSILKQAKALNLRTGFVTTRRVTGPLVAALYAHTSDTNWECDGYIPDNLKINCQDVALQLIKSKEGRNINVVMGGGRQTLISKVPVSNRSIIDESVCDSMDKRNLLKDWQSHKISENVSFKLVQTPRGLSRLKGSVMDYVLGVFANGDITDKGPNLTNMVIKSLDVLKRNDVGYLFVAETVVKSDEVKDFRRVLWDLDETIKETFKYPGFTSNNTVVLTVFLDLNHTAEAPNDIFLYAIGPQSYLFHGVHEETYMAHVISYYLKMGIFRMQTKSKN